MRSPTGAHFLFQQVTSNLLLIKKAPLAWSLPGITCFYELSGDNNACGIYLLVVCHSQHINAVFQLTQVKLLRIKCK